MAISIQVHRCWFGVDFKSAEYSSNKYGLSKDKNTVHGELISWGVSSSYAIYRALQPDISITVTPIAARPKFMHTVRTSQVLLCFNTGRWVNIPQTYANNDGLFSTQQSTTKLRT